MKRAFCLTAFLLVAGSIPASAETRVFILANPPARNGADRCLANSEKCGAGAALSYCQSREFAQAKSYRRVDPDEVTGSVPKVDAAGCPAGGCSEFVAIVCQR